MSSILTSGIQASVSAKTPAFSVRNPDMQLVELRRFHGRWCVGHHIAGRLVLWEGDDLPDIRLVGEQHDQPVNPGRHTTMRRRAILKGLDHVPELACDDLLREPQQFKDLAL